MLFLFKPTKKISYHIISMQIFYNQMFTKVKQTSFTVAINIINLDKFIMFNILIKYIANLEKHIHPEIQRNSWKKKKMKLLLLVL